MRLRAGVIAAASGSILARIFEGAVVGAWFKSNGLNAPAWIDASGQNQDLGQAISDKRPTVQVAANGLNEAVFDGTDDVFGQYFAATLMSDSSVTVPDASASEAGKGFTATGLAYDPTDGTFWAANHGKKKADDPAFQSGIVHLSADLTTVIDEFLLSDLGVSSPGSVQGCCYITSTNRIGIVMYGDGSARTIYALDRDGSTLHTHPANANLAGDGGNGLAYDSILDAIVLSIGNSLRWYDNTSGTLVKFVSPTVSGGSIDQISFDAERNWIWAGYGDNGSDGNIVAIDLNIPTPAVVVRYTLPEVNTIEGPCVAADGEILVTSDHYYHNQSPSLNKIYRFTPTVPSYLKIGERFQLAFIVRQPANQASTKCLLSFGDPQGTGVDGGFGIYFTTSYTVFRMFHRNSSRDVTISSMASTRVIFLDVDLANNAVGLWVDGVHVIDTTFPSANVPSSKRKMLILGARGNIASGSVFVNAEVSELFWKEGTVTANQRTAIINELLSRSY